ncbi:uncharacterized protein [Diadema setosum]|uniref:uncharacterized protein n=1 Tax=Diadema setosum TaxID=31175 RepID=UPI003B3B3AB3
MKDGFVLAMQELSRIQNGDRMLQETLETHKQENDSKVEQLTEMVQSMKGELGGAMDKVAQGQQTTLDLKRQLMEFQQEQETIKKQIQESASFVNNGPPQSYRSRRSWQSEESGYQRGDFEEPKDSVPPMLQPFIDSLPEAGSSPVEPELSDSDDSTIETAEQMTKLSRQFAEQYHRQRVVLASPSADGLLHNRNGNLQNELGMSANGRDSDSKKNKRLMIVESLLSSEKTYVSQLRFVQEGIVQPLVIESIVPINDISVMFPPCLGELYQEHSAFLRALDARLNDVKWKGIMGDVLSRISGSDGSSLLALYATYVKSFSESLSVLANHLSTTKNFYKFVEKQLAEDGHEKSDPFTYLMAPLQRISFYARFMKRLLKYTDKTHPDRFHVESCLRRLRSFVQDMDKLTSTSSDKPSSSSRETQERKRRNSKASFSSQSSAETNLRDSGVHSMEGERGLSNASPPSLSVDRDMWASRPIQSKGKPKSRLRSVPSEATITQDQADGAATSRVNINWSFPSPYQSTIRGQHDDVVNDGHSQLVTQYPENSVVPVPGMIGKGSNAAMYTPRDDRQPGDVIDTSRQRRKSRARRMSLSRQQSFGVFGEDDTDIEKVGYVPSTPANALPRSKQLASSKGRQRRKSIDNNGMMFGHYEMSDSLFPPNHVLLNGCSNLPQVWSKSSDNMHNIDGLPNSRSFNDMKTHMFLRSSDMPMPLPQNFRSGANSRLYARRKSIDVGALQAHIIREERRAELPPSQRTRKKSHNVRSHSPKSRSPTRRLSPPSRSISTIETPDLAAVEGLTEREADAITEQMFVRTCQLPEDEIKDLRQRKASFKHSFKNIFRRKSPGSRVMELADNKAPNSNYLNVDHAAMNGLSARSPSPSPSPTSNSKFFPRPRSPFQRAKTPDMDTFVDENGDPCSAV